MNIILSSLLSSAFGSNIPAGLITFLAGVIPEVIDLVRGIRESEASGGDKRRAAIQALRDAIDESGDTLPEWGELTEEQRDRILTGWVETVYWIDTLVEKHGNKRQARRALLKALNRLKR